MEVPLGGIILVSKVKCDPRTSCPAVTNGEDPSQRCAPPKGMGGNAGQSITGSIHVLRFKSQIKNKCSQIQIFPL